MSRSPRGVVLVGDRGLPFDGVIDHAALLSTALEQHMRIDVLTRTLQGQWRAQDGTHLSWAEVRNALQASDAVILSYAPWNLGLGWKHWRFIVELPKLVWAARHRQRVLFLHELSTTAAGFMGTLDRRAQQGQFRMVSQAFSTVVGATFLVPPRLAKGRTLVPLAMGSNLPDMRHQREAVRRELGLDSSFVVASFVQAYLSPVRHLVSAGLEGSRDATSVPVTHLVLGSSAEPEPVEGVTEYRAGAVSAERLASLLAAADVLLAPFPDGASSRRTTLAAALQHGLPVITNAGELTAPWLRSARGLLVTEPGEESFRAAARTLTTDPARRSVAGLAARRLYEERFQWESVAAALHPYLACGRRSKRQAPARPEGQE